jgi:L-alanine-DL-glutamate epimerase-like enolase superfamily enzyme
VQLEGVALNLKLAVPFRIARDTQHYASNVVTRIRDGDWEGIGEAAPSAFYGESQETVLACLARFAEQLGDDPFALETCLEQLDHSMGRNPAAKAAVDIALHDLIGKRLGIPVYQLFGLSVGRTPLTSFTIGLDTPEVMAQKAQKAQAYPVLKVKLGTHDDLAIIQAVRAVSRATIRVDANAAWTPKQAITIIQAIAPYGIELVEQPVHPDDLDGLRLVRQHAPMPIIADESCVTVRDIPRVAGCVDGINIKLMKCGGLRHALEMIHVARAHGLQVMMGCMIESSIAITAAAHLSPLLDYADLDGNLLVEADPYAGVRVVNGRLTLPDAPGLGIATALRRDAAPT